ncbi:MAG: hypothetical protein LM590_12235, partial [Thermofilum sp.]|nr:hypothetical protein [Thermofilum sp.]
WFTTLTGKRGDSSSDSIVEIRWKWLISFDCSKRAREGPSVHRKCTNRRAEPLRKAGTFSRALEKEFAAELRWSPPS